MSPVEALAPCSPMFVILVPKGLSLVHVEANSACPINISCEFTGAALPVKMIAQEVSKFRSEDILMS